MRVPVGPMPSREQGERRPDLLAVAGHPAVAPPAHVVEATARAAAAPRYAPTRGTRELREAIAAEHGVDPDRNVLVTQGAIQGLALVAAAFGERTVVRAPSFFFPQIVRGAGGECALADDWDGYAAAVARGATLAIVCTPSNPTGEVYRPADLDAIAAALRESPAVLVSDEAYAGLLYDGLEHLSPAGHPELSDRTIVLRSFSKTFGMAAWRVGYAVGPSWAIDTLATALQWQSLAIDCVAQAAARAALTGPRDWIEAAIAELAQTRPLAVAAANDAGLTCAAPDGCAFLWASVDDEARCADWLADAHRIPALPGRHFHARTPHLRIPFGGPSDARTALVERLGSAPVYGAPISR